MAYSEFIRLNQLKTDFGIDHEMTAFRWELENVSPSQHLIDDLSEASSMPLLTEKAKSEFLISPVLKELRRNCLIGIFSGYEFDVDEKRKLTGFCDYLLAPDTQSIEIKSPVFCIVEAKNRSIEEGFAEVGSEMIAARLFNEKNGVITPTVYGCVTNAYEWNFLKLENEILFIENRRYFLQGDDNLRTLLQILCNIAQNFTQS